MAGGCCTTAAALIGCKRPISCLRYKTRRWSQSAVGSRRRLMQLTNAVAGLSELHRRRVYRSEAIAD